MAVKKAAFLSTSFLAAIPRSIAADRTPLCETSVALACLISSSILCFLVSHFSFTSSSAFFFFAPSYASKAASSCSCLFLLASRSSSSFKTQSCLPLLRRLWLIGTFSAPPTFLITSRTVFNPFTLSSFNGTLSETILLVSENPLSTPSCPCEREQPTSLVL